MKFTRKHAVIGVSVLVILAGIGYGIAHAFPRLLDPYAGLTTTIEVQMDESTRNVVRQRLAAAQASVAASEKAGEKVDMGLYLTIAEQYHLLGDLIGARESYEQYLALNSISYTAWNSYGFVLETMGDYEKAAEAYLKSIESYPENEEAYRDYAELLKNYYPDKKTEYKTVLDQAYGHVGQTTWTMTALGDWYFSIGDCGLGRDHYDVARTLAPENTTLLKESRELYDACQGTERE